MNEQLNSILQQTHVHLNIVASDDGSTDRTLDILKQYLLEIHQGPRQGVAANFLSLIDKVDEKSDYYAFADQDDVWLQDKLQRAIELFETVDQTQPVLYCGRTLLVDDHLNPIGHSPLFQKPTGFLNALVQNIGGGNTMVFNKAALKLLRRTENKHLVVAHDWWTYLLISGGGGQVFYDTNPFIYYRQHGKNVVGSNNSWLARLHRIRMLFKGRLKSWITQNTMNLREVSDLLTIEHRQALEAFEKARRSWLIPRYLKIRQLGIYRQTYFGQLGLMIGVIFNKI